MPDHPFRGSSQVDRLYGGADRQRRRTTALLDAKTEGENTSVTLSSLAARHAPPHPCLLEVGCGRGGALKRLVDALEPTRAVGLDRSEAMLRDARARAGKSPELISGDFHRLPFHSEEFDLIVAAFCLYHSDRPEDACLELARCLKPQGAALLATKSIDSYADLDSLVATTGMDPAATLAPSLYESFHSENLGAIASSAFSEVEVRHELHRFVFPTPEAAAAYASTVPKYVNCEDRRQLAKAFAGAWPENGLAMTSTVSIAVARK